MSLHDSTITGRTQIMRLFNHLQDLQCPVTVVIKDLPHQQRPILAVNPDADYLVLDVSVPKGRSFPGSGQAVQIKATFHGEEAACATHILESADMAGKALLRVHLPGAVEYRQRRVYFRILLDTLTPIPVTLVDEENGSLFGTLEDISLGGLAVRLACDPNQPQIHAELCLIHLPGGEIFHSEIELTNTRAIGSDTLRIGARLCRTNDAQLRKLERFIRQIEREQLKKRTD